MYTQQTITEAALHAAQTTATKLTDTPNDTLVSNDQLITMSGLQPPDDTDDLEVHKQWQTALLKLREVWRYAVLDLTGRWPKTVWGQGFEILPPNKNVQHVDTKVLDDVRKVINKGLRIIKKTRNEDLSYSERQDKARARLRFGTLRTAAISAKRTAEKERTWRDTTPDQDTPSAQSQTKTQDQQS
jgi:hypothetical protein